MSIIPDFDSRSISGHITLNLPNLFYLPKYRPFPVFVFVHRNIIAYLPWFRCRRCVAFWPLKGPYDSPQWLSG